MSIRGNGNIGWEGFIDVIDGVMLGKPNSFGAKMQYQVLFSIFVCLELVLAFSDV